MFSYYLLVYINTLPYFYFDSGGIGKLTGGESQLDEITDLIHNVPLLVLILGAVILIISFAGII